MVHTNHMPYMMEWEAQILIHEQTKQKSEMEYKPRESELRKLKENVIWI